MSGQPYYAVARGKEGPAIYRTWPQCKDQVIGFESARYKKFSTELEAKKFIEDNGKAPPTVFTKKSDNAHSDHNNEYKKSESVSKRAYGGGAGQGSSGGKKMKTAEERGWDYMKKNDPEDKDSVVVYTDGACVNNGRHNAKAGIGVYWGDGHKDNVSERLQGRQTNNCAEIQAAVRAVQQAKARNIKSLIIRTDSKFMLQSINEWLPKWQRNGWLTGEGKPVKNKTDFCQLLDAMEGVQVKWQKVKAHCGIKGNEMADRFATQGIHK